MKAYTGIGSRQTPEAIQQIMIRLAAALECQGWVLRSGCAPGADSAFEWGATTMELYLPWPNFEGRSGFVTRLNQPQTEALAIAEQHHPRWASLKQGAKKLHARNVHQILGPDVTNPVPSKFVLCWTPNAQAGGGTGQAIRIAKAYGVPVFDLADPETLERVVARLL